jgi:hypothetical protein
MGGDARKVDAASGVFDEEQDVQARRKTVSTWKKSAARMVWAWADRNTRHVWPCRVGCGVDAGVVEDLPDG